MNSRPIKRPQAPKTEKSKPRRVRAADLGSRPRRAESENRFNFRERAETSARESEPSPRKADSRRARLVCRPARAGQLLIEKLHSKGVYHCDFQRSNLFWESSSSQLRVIDFELAQFRDNLGITESLIESWKNSDKGEMDRIMVECGVPDGRPNRLSSNGKSGSMRI